MRLLGNRLTVDPRTLTPLVLVRIQVPQPPSLPGIRLHREIRFRRIRFGDHHVLALETEARAEAPKPESVIGSVTPLRKPMSLHAQGWMANDRSAGELPSEAWSRRWATVLRPSSQERLPAVRRPARRPRKGNVRFRSVAQRRFRRTTHGIAAGSPAAWATRPVATTAIPERLETALDTRADHPGAAC